MIQDNFNTWLDKIIRTEIPDKDIIAYYFGIFESTDGYITYLTGSKEFDETDSDWACNTDFVPKDKYLNLGQTGTNWEAILEQTKTLIQNFKQSPTFKNSFLDKAKIATGFDDGELIVIE